MHAPARWLRSALLFALTLLLGGSLAGAEPPPELKKLHVLLVVDTNTNLGLSVEADRRMLERMLLTSIPPSRYELKVLTGKDVTADKILKFYKDLKVDPADGLLFYFSGHGATDPKKGHYLALQELKVPSLIRATLRDAMKEKQACLTVLLSDCCSNRYPLKKEERKLEPDKAQTLAPVVRSLLFQHRGIVDVTAATDQFAFGDDFEGGIFTRTFVRLLTLKPEELAKDRGAFVTWKDFYPRLQADTDTTFKQWATDQTKRLQAQGVAEKIEQSTQRPLAFHLPDVQFAVVSLRNPSNEAVRFRYRWTGETAWQNGDLAAKGGTTVLSLPLTAEQTSLPELEAIAEGDKMSSKLAPARVAEATYEAGKKYRFEKSKN